MVAAKLDSFLCYGYSQGKRHPNETPALVNSMNMNIWVVGTSNQLFIRGS